MHGHHVALSCLFASSSTHVPSRAFVLLCRIFRGGTLTQVDWDPRSLREGDSVGLLVTASEGELIIFRNGHLGRPQHNTQSLWFDVTSLGMGNENWFRNACLGFTCCTVSQ